MSADTAQLAALVERVDGYDAKFEALFMLMRETARAAGLDPDGPARREARCERHLHLVKGGQP